MANEDLLAIIKGTEDPELKRLLVAGYLEDRKHTQDSAAQKSQHALELEAARQAAELGTQSARRNFWFGSAFIGLVSAALTLLIGEAFGVVKLNTENTQELVVADKAFERDMIAQAISENDNDQRIDALRLLVLSDLISGLTLEELAEYENSLGDREVPQIAREPSSTVTYSAEDQQLIDLIGLPGTSGEEPDLVFVDLPFNMRVDWNLGSGVTRVRFHRYGACALYRALVTTFEHYGEERFRDLGIDRFAGTYNARTLRGTNRPSRHAWGIAIDLHASKNGLRTQAPEALFSGPDYAKMHEVFEAEGFFNHGKRFGDDWMHFEVTLDKLREKEEPSSCGL